MTTFISFTILITTAGAFREVEDTPFPHGISLSHDNRMADPFAVKNGIKRDDVNDQHSSEFSSKNNWGFDDPLTEWPDEEYTSKLPKRINMRTTTPYYEEIDPKRNGLLKDIGSIDIGFGVGVGVPGNDPVSVGTKVGVGFGASGLAGGLPIGENIFPRQGEMQSLNDYDGNKNTIVPGKAGKYIHAIVDGKVRTPHYHPAPSLVGVGGSIGVGTGR